jgi:hypothetical protein
MIEALLPARVLLAFRTLRTLTPAPVPKYLERVAYASRTRARRGANQGA